MSIINKNTYVNYNVIGSELKSKNSINDNYSNKEIFDHNIDKIIKTIKDLGDKFNITDSTTLKQLGL